MRRLFKGGFLPFRIYNPSVPGSINSRLFPCSRGWENQPHIRGLNTHYKDSYWRWEVSHPQKNATFEKSDNLDQKTCTCIASWGPGGGGGRSKVLLGITWNYPPPRMPVTTRIITFLIGNPYKPSFVTVTGWGVDLRYNFCLDFRGGTQMDDLFWKRPVFDVFKSKHIQDIHRFQVC